MPTTITITPEYGFVAAALISPFYLNIFQMANVSKWRKKAGIQYPQLYAEKAEVAASEDAKKFNCAQRAHGNTLETLPLVLVTTLISSIKFPIVAASLLSTWSLFRVFYTIGYTTGDPRQRNYMFGAMVGSASMLGLLLTATYTSVQLILGH